MAAVSAAVAALISLTPGQSAAVCGYPKSGKTYAVQHASEHWPRVVIIDTNAQRDRYNWALGQRERAPWPGEMISFEELCAAPERLDESNYRLVVDPGEVLDAQALGERCNKILKILWHTGNLVIVGEEAGLYSRQCGAISKVIATNGAHAGIALVTISQRIGTLHIDTRASMSMLICGLQSEPADQDAISARCGPAFAEAARTLTIGDPLLVWRAGYDGAQPSRQSRRARTRG